MANPYFQFKQFTIHQDRSTLKVSTDSCIFGAWVAEKSRLTPPWFVSPRTTSPRALDIGAGTGLLMLMLAQQWNGCIDGIEIDKSAYEQALENIQASPWAGRLHLLNGDIKSFALPAEYDLIISNPPFYEGDLSSPTPHKNLAKHDAGLTLQALLDAVDQCVAPSARLALLLPFHRVEYFKGIAAARGWRTVQQLLVKQTPSHDYFRAALWLEKNYTGTEATETLVIHAADRVYSDRMTALLQPYYLYL